MITGTESFVRSQTLPDVFNDTQLGSALSFFVCGPQNTAVIPLQRIIARIYFGRLPEKTLFWFKLRSLCLPQCKSQLNLSNRLRGGLKILKVGLGREVAALHSSCNEGKTERVAPVGPCADPLEVFMDRFNYNLSLRCCSDR